MLGAFDLQHLWYLRLDVTGSKAAIDDAESSLLRHDDGHFCTGHGVHIGRHQGSFEDEACRQMSREIEARRIAAIDDAELRGQQEIVERAAVDGAEQIHAVSVPRAPAPAQMR